MTAVAVLGCRVDVLDTHDAVLRIAELARGSSPALVVTLGTEMIVRAQRDESFRKVLNESALSLCDTIGVAYAARLGGMRIAQRIAGIDLIDPLCEIFAREGLGLYLLGGKGDTAAAAASVLQKRHPGLIVAGTRDGYFGDTDSANVAATIARSESRILLAGLGSPKQEFWITNYLEETGCSVGIGIGGSLDVLAGIVERAPAIWQRLNLEWLFRLIREPRRWRRQLALPYFVWLVIRERASAFRNRRLSESDDSRRRNEHAALSVDETSPEAPRPDRG